MRTTFGMSRALPIAATMGLLGLIIGAVPAMAKPVPANGVSISAVKSTVTEGIDATAEFQITRTTATSKAVTVLFSTAAGGTNPAAGGTGADGTAQFEAISKQQATIGANETAATVHADLYTDESNLAPKTFVATISGYKGSKISGATVTVTIQDNYFSNGGFENGLAGWRDDSVGGTAGADGTQHYTGLASAKLSASGADVWAGLQQEAYRVPTVTPPDVTVMYLPNLAAGDSVWIYVWDASNGHTISQQIDSTAQQVWTARTFHVSELGVEVGDYIDFSVSLQTLGASTSTFYFDDVTALVTS